MAQRWSKKDEQLLLRGVGAFSVDWFCDNTGDSYTQERLPNIDPGRSRAAVYAKAYRMYGRGGLMRGAYTLRRLARESGYSVTQLLRARDALSQKWRRTMPGGSYIIHEEQALEMTAWLANDYWSKKNRLYCCVWCHTREIPHRGKGLCTKCYYKYAAKLRRCGFSLDDTTLKHLIRVNTFLFVKRKVNAALRELERGRAVPKEMLEALMGKPVIEGDDDG